MKTVKIKLPSGKVLIAEVARTSKDQQIGLLKNSSLEDGEAMLFVNEKPRDMVMHTKGMVFPIDICFLERVGGNDETE